MSHLHLKSGLRSGFRLSTLALSVGMAFMSTSGFALEALNDEGLAESTGEGIALLPENFRMVFQGANDTVTQNTDYANRGKDTGYIRVIPVGPLTTEATNSGAQKADIFLYGLAISHADGDANKRFNDSATGLINSWGTATNPWLIKVQTNNAVPNFAGVSKALSYISLEAPEYNISGFNDPDQHDYHLKLGLWADIFMRNPTVAAPDNNPAGWGAGLSNRMRLQAIWDGFSINGSSLNIFQTLDGATNTGGLSTSYNNTLGLAGTLRFNGGDTRATEKNYKAVSNAGSVSRTTSVTNRYASTNTGQPGANGSGTATGGNLYRLRTVDTVDTVTGGTITLPSNLSTLRFSTQETGTTQGLLNTPAINGGNAPNFSANEGLFMYGANINLVLGQLYQPLVVGVADDGRNLNMEITRIPNKPEVYKNIYTAYVGNLGSETASQYKGSTCNVYQCGTTTGGTFNPATHSSITIGSTNYSGASSNLVTAYSGADAIGVSFGAMQPITPTVSKNYYYQLQQQTRSRNSNTQWKYDSGNGTNNCGTNCNEFSKSTWKDVAGYKITGGGSDYLPTLNHPAYFVPGVTAADGFANGASCSPAPCMPSTTNGAQMAWGMLPGALINGEDWRSNPPPVLNSVNAPTGSLSGTNLGSAVIDGLLIQHMKITTKGL